MLSKFVGVAKIMIPTILLVGILATHTTASTESIKDTMSNCDPFATSLVVKYDKSNNPSEYQLIEGWHNEVIRVEREVIPLASAQLTDIQGHWGQKFIQTLVDTGGVSGYPDGTFKPDNLITVAEFLSIIINQSGNEIRGEEDWGSNVMQSAYDLGVTSTNEFSKVNAGVPISREQMSKVLINTAKGLLGEKTDEIVVTDGDKYVSDLNVVKDTYKESVVKAYKMGLLTGKGEGRFDPNGALTRAETAVVVCKLFGLEARNEAVLLEKEVKVDDFKPRTEEELRQVYRIPNSFEVTEISAKEFVDTYVKKVDLYPEYRGVKEYITVYLDGRLATPIILKGNTVVKSLFSLSNENNFSSFNIDPSDIHSFDNMRLASYNRTYLVVQGNIFDYVEIVTREYKDQ